ncbi:hypothetical protein Pmar_PMAR029188 [Perkinsus marinus ATCC 50983]|uniref:Uncharacterized protein n=1 Tax=Perkinsus marinus (strain ATCC 50983 / TXsc) TaxID=423536 RepID=C5M0V7_PERM5|nr:hypothetical protein Pmar_PMAR029188 [Perkinsus marinus ATCC 50983]EEQ97465.1 hypothetical protein Pmar_PMAR029188 [Perkinsus marinus ATCC 50983]|eukprot:XP_002764748.1 hypothetical protein Pmar_PMAR029188 [Perkinsus marinus ATCC 50983]
MSMPAEAKRYALDVNTEEDVAFKSRTNTLLMTQPQEEPNASRLSWGACTRPVLDENKLEYPSVDPPESPAPLPYTARASPRGSSPAGAQRCVEDAVGAIGRGSEETSSPKMTASPFRNARPKRSSEELLLLSDSDDSAASPPRKKRTSWNRQPRVCRTPVATAGTQTDESLTERYPPGRGQDRFDSVARTPGRHDFASLTRHSCDCLARSRSLLPGITSPSYADRALELKRKEAQLEQFLQQSARRRARLMVSIRKRKREEESIAYDDDGVIAPIRGLELPSGSAEGKWAEGRPAQEGYCTRAREQAQRSSISLTHKASKWHDELYYVPAMEEVAEDSPPPASPTARASHGIFVSEGKAKTRPKRRSSWHGDPDRTVFGDVTPLPLHGSYHRVVVPKANKLLGESRTRAPIDDEQWKALAAKLREKSENYAIVTEDSPQG